MSDFISRESVLATIGVMFERCDTHDITDYRDLMLEAVKVLPSADRSQGEWIRTGRMNIYGGIEIQCSNCGDRVVVQRLEDEWYCRHCGADMGMKGADDDRI